MNIFIKNVHINDIILNDNNVFYDHIKSLFYDLCEINEETDLIDAFGNKIIDRDIIKLASDRCILFNAILLKSCHYNNKHNNDIDISDNKIHCNMHGLKLFLDDNKEKFYFIIEKLNEILNHSRYKINYTKYNDSIDIIFIYSYISYKEFKCE